MTRVPVDAHFRGRVRMLTDRLGGVHIVADTKWLPFVDRLMLDTDVSRSSDATALVVGPLAAVLRHARDTHDDFAFIMPVAQIARPWQRASSWRDGATLELWQAGWTPLNVDRLLVASDDATFEFAIGDARRTPPAETAS